MTILEEKMAEQKKIREEIASIFENNHSKVLEFSYLKRCIKELGYDPRFVMFQFVDPVMYKHDFTLYCRLK